jgi:phospholipid/cholesterol/gamma-HCH transport system ATP-binding protein
MSPSPETSEILLQIKHLSRSFGETVVHRDVSFDLHKGEILALMGSSGGGKSLILKMIIGLEVADSGQIIFERKNICMLNEKEFQKVRTRVGFVFQNGALFDSLTVEENLSYPLRIHTRLSDQQIHDRVNARLQIMDLSGKNELYPDELSGGMEKRAGLLRATMLDPPIVLFDEPTAGLDPAHVALFARAIQRLKDDPGITGIFVTHDVQCAFAVSDRIAILKDGAIYAIGTVEEMKRTNDPWVHSFLFPDFGERPYETRTAS